MLISGSSVVKLSMPSPVYFFDRLLAGVAADDGSSFDPKRLRANESTCLACSCVGGFTGVLLGVRSMALETGALAVFLAGLVFSDARRTESGAGMRFFCLGDMLAEDISLGT